MRSLTRGTALFITTLVMAAGVARAQIDSTWLSADTAKRTATVAVIAGLTSDNAGMNFNGFKAGGLTLTVPKGWTVIVRFTNQDPNLPHSVAIIPDAGSPPVNAGTLAFRGATTKSLEAGLPHGGHDEFSFVASKTGAFLVFCGVPGHGAAGMWIRLKVDGGAGTATLSRN